VPRKKLNPSDQTELLTKLLAISMWNAGASQAAIARALGRGLKWVNDFLKGIPKPRHESEKS
jgi:hypothetical protein